MASAVGIDLGTTNSAVARADRRGLAAIVPNRNGMPTTPSVLCFKRGTILVGEEAKELQALGTYPVAAFFKRQMGNELFLLEANGVDYTATELSSIVLKQLKADAEAELGEAIHDAIVTVPAYFRDPQRKATIEAAEAAGLSVIQTINEPTAAAVAYGIREKGSRETKRLLVYDLGGGTFDVTLLDVGPDGIRVLSSDGDHELGGKNWDDRVLEFLSTRFMGEFGVDPLEDAETFADLLVSAEQSKKQLSTRSQTTVSIVHEGRRGRYELDRETFEKITEDLLERTISRTERVLEDMNVASGDLDGVLLVGGSTRMPAVHRFVERFHGRPAMTGVNVDEAVALGAAIMAHEREAEQEGSRSLFALGGPSKIVDVTNHSLGMIAVNADRSAYVNSIILAKNSVVPNREMRPYQHRVWGSASELEVYMTQGEVDDPGQVTYLGRYVVREVPAAGTGPTIVEIGYSYDVSGTVQVDASVGGIALDIAVEPLPPDVPERFLRPPEEVVEYGHLSAYLAFDLSGSMCGDPLESAKQAANGFLENTDLAHTSLGIIAFSDETRTKLHASQNAREVRAAIGALRCGETGYTNEGHPFGEVLELFRGVSGPRFAIVLADGVWSDQPAAVRRAEACHSAGIEVIAIGFGHADKGFLQAMASSDESSFFTTQEGLVDTFSTIAQVLTQTGGMLPGPTSSGGKLLSKLSIR